MVYLGILYIQGKLKELVREVKLLDLEEMHSLGGKFFFTGNRYTRFGNLFLRFQQKDRFTRQYERSFLCKCK